MSLSKKMEFEIIVEDILNNDKFKSLSRELHHGISRYEHSLRVAKYSYNVATILHMKNYKEITIKGPVKTTSPFIFAFFTISRKKRLTRIVFKPF